MPQGNDHTVKAFDDDLGELRALIAEMGGLAEKAIGDALLALQRRDLELAAAVIEGDARIDALETEIERLAVRIIALRAPMADDLREIVAALKMTSVIERIGDYAKNISKRVPVFVKASEIEALSMLPEMGRIVAGMVHKVLDAFAARDPAKAIEVTERDRSVDDFYNSIFRVLLTYMMENPHHITQCTHLLFIAKNLERVGDHATNIAEMVHFAATGDMLPDREQLDEPIGLEDV